MEDDNYVEFTPEDEFEDNTILFQIDDEEGAPKEVIKVNDDGFFIYGERLKSADDVAAAFRHYFSQCGYSLDDDGRIIAEEVIEEEEDLGTESKEE